MVGTTNGTPEGEAIDAGAIDAGAIDAAAPLPAAAPAPAAAPGAPVDVASVRAALEQHGYLADDGLATSVFLALTLPRPLLLEGEVGVGKTELARTIAQWTGGELIRLQCYEGLDLAQAVYSWDHARQLLHLRTAEAVGDLTPGDAGAVEADLWDERFLLRRPLLRALGSEAGSPPPVLLLDEIDRADHEFEAFLLEFLAEYAVTVPEVGTFRAVTPPVVVITSNRTREVHDALRRRCLYHWVAHPDLEREVAIVGLRVPEVTAALARQVACVVDRLRSLDLYKPPGVAETLDWARALHRLGVDDLSGETTQAAGAAGTAAAAAEATLGSVLKYREDHERVAAVGLGDLLRDAVV